MNQVENNDEELDLGKLFEAIKKFFKNLLRLLFSVLLFFKTKAVLLLIIVVVSGIMGCFLDNFYDTDIGHQQEVIIEPKYQTTKYVYDFFSNIKDNLKDSLFIKEIKLQKETVQNIKNVTIEPIKRYEDILMGYSELFPGENFDISTLINDLEVEQLDDEKYRYLFKHHRIKIQFYNANLNNTKVIEKFLSYIKDNQYFKNELANRMMESKTELEQNKKSIEFINNYLDKEIKTSPAERNNILIGGVNDIPTVASLLNQKEIVLQKILEEEENLTLNNEIYSIVHFGKIISTKYSLGNRMLFLLPMILLGIVVTFFFLKYLFMQAQRFIEEGNQ